LLGGTIYDYIHDSHDGAICGDDSLKTELFDIVFPVEIDMKIVKAVSKLSGFLRDPHFTKTFSLKANHGAILEVISDRRLKVRFTKTDAYNQSVVGIKGDHQVKDEYGYFDAAINPNCLHINYDV
jgi:hypothetical protein